ncbi:MAG TPA: hypothetical protein VNG53_09495 [Bacteroidia bacterium]|nr:hypothetical protein [Bacteroidia bacterium]
MKKIQLNSNGEFLGISIELFLPKKFAVTKSTRKIAIIIVSTFSPKMATIGLSQKISITGNVKQIAFK